MKIRIIYSSYFFKNALEWTQKKIKDDNYDPTFFEFIDTQDRTSATRHLMDFFIYTDDNHLISDFTIVFLSPYSKDINKMLFEVIDTYLEEQKIYILK